MKKQGFTLLEMLAVMAIIGILTAILLPALSSSNTIAKITDTKARMDQITSALTLYKTRYRDYPRSSLPRGSKLRLPNEINVGIELLAASLFCKGSGGEPYMLMKEQYVSNTDKDEVRKKFLPWDHNSKELFEFKDAWGNPFVYIYWKDYGAETEYQRDDGEKFKVQSASSGKFKKAENAHSYQIWSLGPNGQNLNGAESSDDITNFK
jgi:prepilin-type N-terminal cleavage/methylation domain-containing protein